ncbi:hypothetical protein V6N13_021207 [Hibiscus sabdariffa]|uniref:Uncharacterized protein n=1 Tax=Hibiscus sabdariffa TaxID=183260 RepID=A0ABR2EVR9_9ROSI
MAQCRRRLALLVWFLLIFTPIVWHSHGSSLTTNPFKVKPKSQHNGHFLGFLPRRFPIPASAPSRKHNGLGLQNWRSP